MTFPTTALQVVFRSAHISAVAGTGITMTYSVTQHASCRHHRERLDNESSVNSTRRNRGRMGRIAFGMSVEWHPMTFHEILVPHSLSRCLMRLALFVSAIVACVVGVLQTTPAAERNVPREVQTVLILPPGEGNPRNSEGDFVRLEDDRLLFVYTRFTGGGSDHDSADLVSRFSTDDGKTWSAKDEVVLQNEGSFNVMSVSLLRLADNRIALFYLRKNSLTDCRPCVRFSDDEAKTWSQAISIIGDQDVGYYILNNDRVVQLANGRLVAPLALHNRPDWEKPDWQGEILCYLSDDGGRTWRGSKTMQQAHGPDGNRITAQEPGVIELKDGRLLLWIRTNAGQQYQCFSSDGGDTWSALEPMGLASPVSPASIERIPATGDLLVVWNNHAQLPVRARKVRTPYTVAISRDEAKTWENIRNIEDDPKGWFCYTAIDFTADHVLLAHVAGKQAAGQRLATTRITRFPVSWLYDR